MRDQPALNILLKEDVPGKSFDQEWNDGAFPNATLSGELTDEQYDEDSYRKLFRFKFPSGSPRNQDELKEIFVGILPISLFTNGHIYFVQQSELLGRKNSPISVHATYQFGDKGYPFGKRQRLRERMIWHADDDKGYYDGNDSENFLYIDESIQHLPISPVDVNLDIDSRVALRLHFEEDRYRRRLILDAIGIAYALNRTLILPKSMCYCDKTWEPITSCWPYNVKRSIDFPFECPLDHIFDVERLIHSQNFVPLKEHSYLANPKTSETIKDDQITVEVHCDFDNDDLSQMSPEVVSIPCGINDEDLRNQLASFASHRVLRFKSVSNVLCSFINATDARALEEFAANAMKSAETNFCSTEPYKESGSPRRDVSDLIVRHCGMSRREYFSTHNITIGSVRNDSECSCEFGMTEVESFEKTRRRMQICNN